MRYQLTNETIEEVAARPGARRIAVENFLATMDYRLSMEQQDKNLVRDSYLYGWSTDTVAAIHDGVCMAEHGAYQDASGNLYIHMLWILERAER